jgi:hypothetical protein
MGSLEGVQRIPGSRSEQTRNTLHSFQATGLRIEINIYEGLLRRKYIRRKTRSFLMKFVQKNACFAPQVSQVFERKLALQHPLQRG